MTGAVYYVRNCTLHHNLRVDDVAATIQKLVTSHKLRLHRHPNDKVLSLLFPPAQRRLKRNHPQDLLALFRTFI